MFSAKDPHSSVVYDGEAMTRTPAPTVTAAKEFVCVDPKCKSPLIWKPGNGGIRPHWAHKNGKTSCGGAAMSAEHLAMQDSVLRWPCAVNAKKEVTLPIPAGTTTAPRTLEVRRADVGVRFVDPTGSVVRVVVECQNSASSREDEEMRVTDINLAGFPVLLAVSAKWVRDAGNGKAHVNFWVRDWAHRHGRRQIAVIDDDGTLWWVKFTGREPLLDSKSQQVSRVPIRFGERDRTGMWELGLCVDTTRPSAKGVPSLMIAAPAWLHRTEQTAWRRDRTWSRPVRQPSHIARADYLGSPGGWGKFDNITVGGF